MLTKYFVIAQGRTNRFATTLLIIMYAVGTVGIFTTYYTYHHRLFFQASIKESKDEELQNLFFTREEYESIEWIDDETEFEWHGKLYDVSKIYETRGGYMIVCENDSLEEMLMALFKATQGGEQRHGLEKGNPQPQFFCAIFSVLIASPSSGEERRLHERQSFYDSIQPEISSPPPKYFSSLL